MLNSPNYNNTNILLFVTYVGTYVTFSSTFITLLNGMCNLD